MLRYDGIILLVEFSKYLGSFSMIWSGIRLYDINSLAYFLLNHSAFAVKPKTTPPLMNYTGFSYKPTLISKSVLKYTNPHKFFAFLCFLPFLHLVHLSNTDKV